MKAPGREMKLAFTLMVFLSSTVVAETAEREYKNEPNRVIISGQSRGRKFLERGGNSSVVRPSEETQFDVNTQFKLDPSISATDHARPSGGGFSLPLFRGNDARSSHVFLDDVELQDPFTGYPLIEDIDLRAFGELRVHRGLAPWDLSVASPGGVVQFISRRVTKNSLESGLIYGDIFGLSGWGEAQAAKDEWETRTYLRRHTANGHYSFYSDNGTVRNVEDDVKRQRDNNDRSANMGSTSLRYQDDKNTAEIFAWVQENHQGIPIRSAVGDGNARLQSATSAWTAKYRRGVTQNFGVGLSAQQLAAARHITDAGQNISRAVDQTFSTRTSQTAAKVDYLNDDETFSTLVQVKRSVATIAVRADPNAESYRPHADQTTGYFGAKYQPLLWLEFEGKADVSQVATEGASSSAQRDFGITSMGHWGDWSLWLQGASFERLPSLFEREGNGAEFTGNELLISESGRFYEVGVRQKNIAWAHWNGERAFTFWSEDMRDRIRSLPISTTQWKSSNMGFERYRGLEGREKWQESRVELEGAIAYTYATNDRGRLIPRVSLWQGVFGAGFRVLPEWMLRTTSRYQGPSYDDEENTLEIGDVWIHDLSIDRFVSDSWWALGVSALNVTDVKSVPVRDVATSQNEGRIAWESRQREPLPGRQYVVRVTAKM